MKKLLFILVLTIGIFNLISGQVYTNASAVNFRPDIWVLPFLNVYGLLPFWPVRM